MGPGQPCRIPFWIRPGSVPLSDLGRSYGGLKLGMLSNQCTVQDFYPIEYIPRGVRFTSHGGDATDTPQPVLQGFLDTVADESARVSRAD